MNKYFVATLIAATIAMCAIGQNGEYTPEYPVKGMSAIDFAKSIQQISLMLPVGPKVIGATAINENKINIHLGVISGPLAGHGQMIIYERIKGEWTETLRAPWVS